MIAVAGLCGFECWWCIGLDVMGEDMLLKLYPTLPRCAVHEPKRFGYWAVGQVSPRRSSMTEEKVLHVGQGWLTVLARMLSGNK